MAALTSQSILPYLYVRSRLASQSGLTQETEHIAQILWIIICIEPLDFFFRYFSAQTLLQRHCFGDFGYGIGLTRALILLHYVVDGRRWIRGSEGLFLEIFRDFSSPLTIPMPFDFGGSFIWCIGREMATSALAVPLNTARGLLYLSPSLHSSSSAHVHLRCQHRKSSLKIRTDLMPYLPRS